MLSIFWAHSVFPNDKWTSLFPLSHKIQKMEDVLFIICDSLLFPTSYLTPSYFYTISLISKLSFFFSCFFFIITSSHSPCRKWNRISTSLFYANLDFTSEGNITQVTLLFFSFLRFFFSTTHQIQCRPSSRRFSRVRESSLISLLFWRLFSNFFFQVVRWWKRLVWMDVFVLPILSGF